MATWSSPWRTVATAAEDGAAPLVTHAAAAKAKLASTPAVLDKWAADLAALAAPARDAKKPAATK